MKKKIIENFAFMAFVIMLIIIINIVGFLISHISIRSHASNINNEHQCRREGHAWHATQGCFTQEMFIENFAD